MRHSFLSRALLALALFVAGGCTAAASSPPSTAASIAASTASGPFGFGFPAKHKSIVTEPTVGGLANVYDTRFGTDSPTTITANGGWFTFGLHSGNHRDWVDSVNGNDANTCASIAQACATFDHAFSVFNSTFTAGGGDQLMVAGGQGQSYTNHATAGNGGYFGGKGGISMTYPTAVLSYDSTDPTNSAKYGRLTGSAQPVIRLDGTPTYGNSFQDLCCDGEGYFAVQGITFDGEDINGNAITYQGGRHPGIAYQNDRFNDVELSINGSNGNYDATGASYTQGFHVSKSAFWGQWAGNGNDSGVYVQRVKSPYIQDNKFWHAGWRVGSARDDTFLNGGPHYLGHGDYVGAINMDIRLDRNSYADDPQDGYNSRGAGEGTSIAALDDPIAGNVGDISGNLFLEAPDGVVNQTTDLLVMGGADISTSLPRAQGLWMTNDLSGSFVRNAAFFDNPLHNNGSAHFVTDYSSQTFAPTSATHSGSTAIVTYVGHGFVNGNHISCDHGSPTDYNVTYQTITVIDADHFSYPMATTPASDLTNPSATVCTPQVPSFMLMDKIRSYNYSNSLSGTLASSNVMSIINLTFTDTITDQLAPGAGNQAASGALFPNYKTRDQVITAVLQGVGITPGANYYVRKGQLIDAELEHHDWPWPQWLIGVGFQAMGLTPTYTTPAYQTITSTPPTIFKSTLTDLTLSDNSFTPSVSKTVLLAGVSALPVLSSSDMPAGCSLAARAITCNASAGTYTVHVTENSQDGTAPSHMTALVLNIGGADTTPPTLSSAVGTSTGTSTATIGATTNEGNGTLYGVVATSSTAPSAVQVKAGQDNSGAAAAFAGNVAVSSTGAKTISATGLAASTTYYGYLMHEDAAANKSTVIASASFTTSAAAFSPSSLSPDFWVEADPTKLYTDSGTTLVSADGDAVQQANDKSTAASNLTQTTLANKPLYKVGTSSKHYMHFDGSNDYLTSSLVTSWQDGTGANWWAMSIKINSHSTGSGEHRIASLVNGATIIGYVYYIDNVIGLNIDGTHIEATGGTSDFTNGVPLVIIATETSTSAELFINNVSPDGPLTLTGTRNSGSAHMTIGSNNGIGAADVDIYGIIHGPGTITSTARANLQTYLSALHEFMPIGLVGPAGFGAGRRRRKKKGANDNCGEEKQAA